MYRYEENKEYYDSLRRQTDEFRRSLKIDINRQLKADAESNDQVVRDKANTLLQAIETNTPCILYQDHERGAVILPKLRLIVKMFPGKRFTTHLCTPQEFQNHVKALYVIYPSIDYAPNQLVRSALTIALSKLSILPSVENK
jgi:hypothetical protein